MEDKDYKLEEDIEDEELQEEEDQTVSNVTTQGSEGTDVKYRAVCPSCSGIAYYTDGEYTQSHCNNCGSDGITVEADAFIELSQEEKDRYALNS